ncbi:VWA domain containing CoxE-like protein [Symmachiella dynata]|uniref:DUF58 domain-containing protein n=1 Tax=Symmachiella dynata TaxID=2527995 RepID=UPI001188CAB1|nr:DUF58 domain-containing protein [Symmachiella dynata]QDT50733.1 VWA domain containing CoxE-like protein [Symmachiella dynata]
MSTAPNGIELLDSEALGKVGNLELLSTNVVDGVLSGLHRSTLKGGCFEFAEHRAYSAGDEIRLIDWRVYAKSDRYYIKQFEEETNLQAVMVVDASGSMQYGHSTVSKLDYARMACACLSRLMLRQRDAVGIALIDQKMRQYIPPRAHAHHLQAILDALRRNEAGGMTSLAGNLQEVARRIKRRGLIVIFSDCFGELEPLKKAIHHLRLRGHEVLIFHVLAPEERTFPFDRFSQFECFEEDGLRIDLDPPSVRKAYLERMRVYLEDLQESCARLACDYVPLSTADNLGDTLAYYLNRRAARIKK